MELALNIIWFALAIAGLLHNRNRSGRVLVAVLCAAVLLFPVISVSDDLNQGWTYNEPPVAVVAMMVLLVAFVTLERVRRSAQRGYVVQVFTPSDPRSPPAR